MVEIRAFEPDDVGGIAALCEHLGWPSYADPTVALAGCTAPGVVVRVAVDAGIVVGFAHACGDGVVQSFLSLLGVHADHRRRGIARSLVEAAFEATGTTRMDLLTDDAQPFYATFAHQQKPGFRIYPGVIA